MVKKVIDIYPPHKEDPDDQESQTTEADQMPSIAPYIEIPAKPKITFIATPQKIGAKTGRGWNLNGAAGFFVNLAVVLAVFFAVMYMIDARYARAIVAITPQTDQVIADKQISVDTKLTAPDVVKQSIPGINATIDKDFSGDFKSTGKASTQAKATGAVKVTNNFTTAQRLIKGTRLQAPTDKFQPALGKDQTPWFRTVNDVTIQPKSSVTVSVVADGAGTQYNIAPSAFSIPGLAGTPQYTYITAQSSEKFTGGTDSAVAQVTQDDLDNAKTSLTSIIQDQMKNELVKKLTDAQELIPETINITLSDITPNVAAGAAAETFIYKAKVHATAIMINKSDLDNFAKDLILNNVKSGYGVDPASLQVSQTFVKNDPVTGLTVMSLDAKENEYPKLDENALAQSLAGRSVAEARAILEDPKIAQPVSIELRPFWRQALSSWFSLPKDADRIVIESALK